MGRVLCKVRKSPKAIISESRIRSARFSAIRGGTSLKRDGKYGEHQGVVWFFFPPKFKIGLKPAYQDSHVGLTRQSGGSMGTGFFRADFISAPAAFSERVRGGVSSDFRRARGPRGEARRLQKARARNHGGKVDDFKTGARGRRVCRARSH